MHKAVFHIVNLLLSMAVGTATWGQTCCSAGAPVSSYLAIQNTAARSFAFQFAYEYNSINRLIDNNKRIENDPRTRLGQSFSWKVDYMLNKKWAFSLLLPLIHQSRSTVSETQGSFGIGDLIFLSQYTINLKNQQALNLSAGIKLPTGITNHKASSGIFLSPDMQSGSGSYDYIFRVAYTNSKLPIPFLSAHVDAAYRLNTTNENFARTANSTGRRFSFGDEFISQLGLRYLITTAFGFFTPDAGITIRWTKANTEQFVSAPNSGGVWLNIPFGITFSNDDKKSISIRGELPIYQNLNGLQITTNYKIGLQLNYNLNKKSKNDHGS